MSIRLSRVLTIAMIATGIGAVMLPTETVARVPHRHGAARAAYGYLPPNAYGYVAPPVVFYRARPLPYYVGPVCDPARDWNC
jgi:hypothetical protein